MNDDRLLTQLRAAGQLLDEDTPAPAPSLEPSRPGRDPSGRRRRLAAPVLVAVVAAAAAIAAIAVARSDGSPGPSVHAGPAGDGPATSAAVPDTAAGTAADPGPDSGLDPAPDGVGPIGLVPTAASGGALEHLADRGRLSGSSGAIVVGPLDGPDRWQRSLTVALAVPGSLGMVDAGDPQREVDGAAAAEPTRVRGVAATFTPATAARLATLAWLEGSDGIVVTAGPLVTRSEVEAVAAGLVVDTDHRTVVASAPPPGLVDRGSLQTALEQAVWSSYAIVDGAGLTSVDTWHGAGEVAVAFSGTGLAGEPITVRGRDGWIDRRRPDAVVVAWYETADLLAVVRRSGPDATPEATLAFVESLAAASRADWEVFVGGPADLTVVPTATTSEGVGTGGPGGGSQPQVPEQIVTPDEVRVLVVNGQTGVPGLATDLKDELAAAGYTNQLEPTNGPTFAQTTLLFRAGYELACERLGAFVANRRGEAIAKTPITQTLLEEVTAAGGADCVLVIAGPPATESTVPT